MPTKLDLSCATVWKIYGGSPNDLPLTYPVRDYDPPPPTPFDIVKGGERWGGVSKNL